jgi:PPOX class probable F420-dependent enzyme
MAHEDALDFLRRHHRAVLATHRRDGGIQQSPVLAAVDDAGRVMISTREGAMKTHNLRRQPRASLCALSEQFFGSWYSLEGPVEVISLPEAMDLLVDYYRRVGGEHPDWDEYRAAMEREQRVVLRITVDRSGPRVQG